MKQLSTSRYFVTLFFNSWDTSQKYWLLTATLTNVVSIILLISIFKREGSSFRKLFRFNRENLRKDLLIFIGLALLMGPVALFPVLFLSIQHCTLPLIPDARFILYRGLVFLPFALMLGVSLKLRPSLFPCFAVLHGVMDLGTATMFLIV